MSKFQKATKKQARLRMTIVGPSGSGKTYSALSIASAMGGRIAVIDTEHGSASKYAGIFQFDVLELTTFAPANYVAAISDAVAEGYDIIVIDSLSHAWMGKGGALEMVDKAAKASRSGNSYVAWGEVTPEHNKLIEAIVSARAHVFFTMRVKQDYAQERNERTGKTEIRRVGLAPVQRDGMEYEADVLGEMNLNNVMTITKSRCPELMGKAFDKPGAELAATLKAWLSDGEAVTDPAPKLTDDLPSALRITEDECASIREWVDVLSINEDAFLKFYKVASVEDMTPAQYEHAIHAFAAKAKKNDEAAA